MTGPILIVEDDATIVDVLSIALKREGFDDVRAAGSAAEALECTAERLPSIVVLDIGLPDTDGFVLALRLRETAPNIPIMFLTARDRDADKLMGFGVGADDYVTKPFNPLEVVARIRAVLRRARAVSGALGTVRDFGRFQVLTDEGRLIVEGNDVAVPAREFRLLSFLANMPGRVFSSAQIYREVWGVEPIGTADQNTVSVHVHRVRDKIEPEPGVPQYLVTVRGLGYKLVEPGAE